MTLNKAISGSRCINCLYLFESDTINSKVILEVYVCFASFIDNITFSTSAFLFLSFGLYLVGDYLLFVLKAIIENNKINKKKNSKIKTIIK